MWGSLPCAVALNVFAVRIIPMHQREQEQHPGTNQYRSHRRRINARQSFLWDAEGTAIYACAVAVVFARILKTAHSPLRTVGA
jgi:hypothetical protein